MISKMLRYIITLFKKPKPIIKTPLELIFIDGDQDANRQIATFNKISNDRKGFWIHVQREIPRKLSKIPNIEAISVRDMAAKGKETTDKYIAIAIQKGVSEGIKKFTVISRDYDFVDIFKMIVMSNPEVELDFTLVAAKAQGRLLDAKSTSTISIVLL